MAGLISQNKKSPLTSPKEQLTNQTQDKEGSSPHHQNKDEEQKDSSQWVEWIDVSETTDLIDILGNCIHGTYIFPTIFKSFYSTRKQYILKLTMSFVANK